MFNVGDWGWLIGASVGAIVYSALSKQDSSVIAAVPAGE